MRSSVIARATSTLACAVLAGLAPVGAQAQVQSQAQASARFDAATLYGLGARNIGSAEMSGRVSAIAGRDEPDGKTTLLVGAASGGVWRSDDGGTTFRPIFDREPVQSIGAIAFDPRRAGVIWVGTGESWMRNSVSVGDGVYKSTDGGETWANMGLPNSEHVAKIIVDPTDSDTVYACVPGRLWSDSADRGLYKTTDGGRTWALILKGANLSTGCSSLALDPKTPRKLFAAMWDFRRKGWTFRSGGDTPEAPSGSGLWVSEDGGARWKRLDAASAPGLPKGPWGREAVSIAPSDPKVVYAFVESARSALFRSDDGGKTWHERDRSQNMVWRPFYFANLVIDPKNPDRLFKTDFGLIVSEDGGASFSQIGSSTHADHHAVWVDPANTRHMVTGNDGGLWISYDGGARWNKTDNLPISQFYHVSLDDKDPYQVYGGLQDNSAWVGDSAYPGGVSNSRWENLGGGDGFWAWADPADPEGYAYVESQGGSITRVNRKTLESRDIQPKSESSEKLRFNWNTPVVLSPNDKGVIYIGAQYLFRSKDHGQSWDRISPDLTTNDKDQQKQEESGGVTVDNSAAETHTTIYAVSEAKGQPGVIWVGTDDGKVQLTRDGGRSWIDLTRNVGLPPQSWVSWIEASPSTPGAAYATFDRHTFGDMTPYVYKTTDLRENVDAAGGPVPERAGLRARHQGGPAAPGPPLPGNRVRPVDLAGRGRSVGAVPGGRVPAGSRARPGLPGPRRRPGRRHARPRHLDRRRPRTPARLDAAAHGPRLGVPAFPSGAAADRGQRRLVDRRRAVRRGRPAGRRPDRLSPAPPQADREAVAAGARFLRQGRGHLAGLDARGDQPGGLGDACAGSPRAAGRATGGRLIAWATLAAGDLHGAADGGRSRADAVDRGGAGS